MIFKEKYLFFFVYKNWGWGWGWEIGRAHV